MAFQCDCDKYKPDCRCHEIPAGAMYIEPAERITRPNDGETTETRLGRIEAWIQEHTFTGRAKDVPEAYDNEPLASQVDRLARVLMDEFGGPTRSEGAVDMAIRLLREQRDDPRLQPLRPEPDLTLGVLQRLKERDMHVIPAPWVSVVIACTVDALNARRGAAVYYDEQDG